MPAAATFGLKVTGVSSTMPRAGIFIFGMAGNDLLKSVELS
jgi:hypothetical protein